jgi:hypothetical protein
MLCHEFQIKEIWPHVLLYANYYIDGYEGYCWALTAKWDGCVGGKRQNVKFYLVEASHCSCFGLEGQWEPHEITREVLENKQFYGDENIKEEILKALDDFNKEST